MKPKTFEEIRLELEGYVFEGPQIDEAMLVPSGLVAIAAEIRAFRLALADLLEGLSKLERAKAKASPKKRARAPKKPARKGARK